MSTRALRWWWFGALALALPFPMLGPFEAWVPPVRYAMLLGAASAVAIAEGMAGPVPMILALLALNVAASLFTAWLAAWVVSRGVGAFRSPERQRRASLVAACVAVAGLALAASLPIYTTTFGRAPTASLLGALH